MDFGGGLNIEVSCNILRRWNILCCMTCWLQCMVAWWVSLWAVDYYGMMMDRQASGDF